MDLDGPLVEPNYWPGRLLLVQQLLLRRSVPWSGLVVETIVSQERCDIDPYCPPSYEGSHGCDCRIAVRGDGGDPKFCFTLSSFL